MATQYPFQASLLQMGAKIKPLWAKENLNTVRTSREAFETFMNSDFQLSSEPVLPEKVGNWHKRVIDGPIILQVESFKNVGEPFDREQLETPLRRVKFVLSDGTQQVEAFERHRLTHFRLAMKPGTKFRLTSAMVLIGMVCLDDQSCEVLGGSKPRRDGEEEEEEEEEAIQNNNRTPMEDIIPPLAAKPQAKPFSLLKPFPALSSLTQLRTPPPPSHPLSTSPVLKPSVVPKQLTPPMPSLKKPAPPVITPLRSFPVLKPLSKPSPPSPPAPPAPPIASAGSKRPLEEPENYFDEDDLDEDPALRAVLEEMERKEAEARQGKQQYSPGSSPPQLESNTVESNRTEPKELIGDEEEEKKKKEQDTAPSASQTWEDVADDTGAFASDDDRPPFVPQDGETLVIEEEDPNGDGGGGKKTTTTEEEEKAEGVKNVPVETEIAIDFPRYSPPQENFPLRELPGVNIRALLSPLLTSSLVPYDDSPVSASEHRFTLLANAIEQAATKNVDQIWAKATVSGVDVLKTVENRWSMRVCIDDGTGSIWATIPDHLITEWMVATTVEYHSFDAETQAKMATRFAARIRSLQGLFQLTLVAGSKEATLEAVRPLNQTDLQIARKRVQEILKSDG